jgi:archaetidylinositol phosphate synthase
MGSVSTTVHSRGAKDRPARELVVAVAFGPLARGLARVLLPLRVPPSAVVLANAVAGFAAAALVYDGRLLVAALLLQLKTLLDNADGRLARISGRVTRFGRFLDSDVDLLVNVALFVALGSVTDQPWLALAAFLALTIVLSANHNAGELYREVHGAPVPLAAPTGSLPERVVEGFYRVVFAHQDHLVRGFVARRLERLLGPSPDEELRLRAERAYNDRATMIVFANLGLSTQLAVLGLCLALDVPEVYLWLVLGSLALLPVLALRRERIARRALSEPRAA